MQKIACIAVSVLFVFGVAWSDEVDNAETAPEPMVEIAKDCPVQPFLTDKSIDSCLKCHVAGTFKVKEVKPHNDLILPTGLSIIPDGNQESFYYLCDTINPTEINDIFLFMDKHPEISRKLVIEIHNPGGSAFDAWREVNIIQEHWPVYQIKTILNGMAFSAGFMLFNAGEIRECAPTAELMWHEISYYEGWMGPVKVSPTSSEGKVKMMRHLQDTANTWLSTRSGGKSSKELLDDQCKIEAGWWFNCEEALEMGFADNLIH